MKVIIKKFSMLLPLIFFFPFYFTNNGIYTASTISGNYSEGLVLSGLFILVTIIVFKFISNQIKISYIPNMGSFFILSVILVFFLIIHSLIGYLIFDSYTIFIVNGQFLASLTGITISYYFVFIKKFDIEKVFYIITIIFLFAMISNIIVSINKVGIINTFGRNIWPSTIFSGIYHHWVYYPYIISFVFLFAAPIWLKKSKLTTLFVYLFVFLYIFIFEVRGAIISFLIGVLLLVVFYIKPTRKFYFLSVLFTILGIIFFPQTIKIGRFTESPYQMISHRLVFIQLFITNLITNPSYLLFGSVSKLSIYGIEKNTTSGILTLHNQYLNLIDNYGLVFAIYIYSFLIYYLRHVYKRIKSISNTFYDSKMYVYWLSIIINIFIIDFNINEELTTGNPGVYLTFYLSVILFYLVLLSENSKKSKVSNNLLK